MVYNSCSIDEVIARIIRNTRIQDSSYIADFNEWIPEAMNHMKTKYDLGRAYKDIDIVFHKGKLPCDLVYLDAVEYNGERLPTSNTVKHYATGHNIPGSQSTLPNTPLFSSIVTAEPNQTYFDENNLQYHSDIQPISDPLAQSGDCLSQPSRWYSIEMEYITTSFSDGEVRLYYASRPVDENGLPLIPDNENYKEAIYNYVRAKMIGTGFVDKVYKEEQLMERFELYARRAINEITYPTPDEREQHMKTFLRFIPPANYWENFFRTDNPEKTY